MPVDSAFSRPSESKCASADGSECSWATTHLTAADRAGQQCLPRLQLWGAQLPGQGLVRRATPGAAGAVGADGGITERCRIEKVTALAWQLTSPWALFTCRVSV